MWHASVHGRFGGPPIWAVLEEVARIELHGVGDAQAGEWVERGPTALHIRRRLTAKEMAAAGIDDVRDVRGTVEQQERIARMRPFLPDVMSAMPIEALP